MKRNKIIWVLFLWSCSSLALGNEFYDRAPDFNLPSGMVAYMGCYWAPMKVMQTDTFIAADPGPGSAGAGTPYTVAKGSGFSIGLSIPNDLIVIGDRTPPPMAQAMTDTNTAVIQRAVEFGMSIDSVDFNIAYQNALLMHILSPAKYSYNPGITKFCGGKPYALIIVVDYYADYPSSIKIREKEKDNKISYQGKRSIIEEDKDVFANQGKQNAVALEAYLVSTQTGNTVWQAHMVTTRGINSFFRDIAKDLIGNALKNLMKK